MFSENTQRTFWCLPALALFVSLASPISRAQTSADGSESAFPEVPERQVGFHLLDAQKYPEAREQFSAWISEHPADSSSDEAELGMPLPTTLNSGIHERPLLSICATLRSLFIPALRKFRRSGILMH